VLNINSETKMATLIDEKRGRAVMGWVFCLLFFAAIPELPNCWLTRRRAERDSRSFMATVLGKRQQYLPWRREQSFMLPLLAFSPAVRLVNGHRRSNNASSIHFRDIQKRLLPTLCHLR